VVTHPVLTTFAFVQQLRVPARAVCPATADAAARLHVPPEAWRAAHMQRDVVAAGVCRFPPLAPAVAVATAGADPAPLQPLCGRSNGRHAGFGRYVDVVTADYTLLSAKPAALSVASVASSATKVAMAAYASAAGQARNSTRMRAQRRKCYRPVIPVPESGR
jgi:hypothetical protein